MIWIALGASLVAGGLVLVLVAIFTLFPGLTGMLLALAVLGGVGWLWGWIEDHTAQREYDERMKP